MASASDAPDSTSVRVCRMTARNSCLPPARREYREHCTSGRPASIITENWRTKTARFFAATFLPVCPPSPLGGGVSLGDRRFGWRDPRHHDLIAPERSDGASLVSAARSHADILAARVRPE